MKGGSSSGNVLCFLTSFNKSTSDTVRNVKSGSSLVWLCSVLVKEKHLIGSNSLRTEMRLITALLTLMCSNSRSVSTLTDWLMILSREELALSADSSLPCGSHCLQRSTKDLEDIQRHEAPLSVNYHYSRCPGKC